MLKVSTIAALAACAGVAHADFFFVGTEGDFEVTGMNGDEIEATQTTVVGTQFGPFGFTSVEGSFTATLGDPGTDGPFEGTFELFGADPGDVLTIEASGTTDNGFDESFFSYAATWEVIGATGAYEGLVGSGDLSGSNFFDGKDGGFVSFQVQGVLVPTPAAGVVLGLGGLVAFRRRR